MREATETEKLTAYEQGYRTFQIRRGLNPNVAYSYQWKDWENGWAQAYADNAPDLSHEELERRASTVTHSAYRKALDARKALPNSGQSGAGKGGE